MTVWFADAAITTWRAQPRTTRGGRPLHSDLAIATAPRLRAVFRLALRRTEGLIGLIIALPGLDLAVPDHSTLGRRAKTLEVPAPRSRTALVPLLVDSTGLKPCGSGEWLEEGTERHSAMHGTRCMPAWTPIRADPGCDPYSQRCHRRLAG